MNVDGKHYRTIWVKKDQPNLVSIPNKASTPNTIQIIDQRKLPHLFEIEELRKVDDAERAIREMHVRGAPLIGVTAAYGMYLAALEASEASQNSTAQFLAFLKKAASRLKSTRPTAVDLAWAVDQQLTLISNPSIISSLKIDDIKQLLFENAWKIAEDSAESCRKIGEHGLRLVEEIYEKKKLKDKNAVVNILTHCNAGWLGCVDYGTATSPIYAAHDKGIPVHVWVDETRPRNQGAFLTAWELSKHGVPHTVVVDNTGGHLMQHGLVDICIVGSDRTTRNGDVANKIGTYLKALAAHDNHIPFYVALPKSSFDFSIKDGVKDIPIEERSDEEVKYVEGLCGSEMKRVLLIPSSSHAANYGFDVTPARLISGLITEKGICNASEKGILGLFPEKRLMKR